MTKHQPPPENTDSLPDRPRGPEEFKAMRKALGLRRLDDLCPVARTNDPFISGGPADQRAAAWFMDVWQQHGKDMVEPHVRRLHYRLASTPGSVRADGTPYLDDDKCWVAIQTGMNKARDLGLIPAGALVDRRTNPLVENMVPRDRPEPSLSWAPPEGWWLPSIAPALAEPHFDLGSFVVDGYDHDPGDNPYLLEVWVEKTTVDDVLVPLCEELGINLLRGMGFSSRTNAIRLVQRAQAGRPVRVWCIDDFDPAGSAMAVATARVAQFFLEELAPGADVAIELLALTREQVELHSLPRVPVKVGKSGKVDRRGKRFEERFGEGVVELDALEALRPGELERLVREAVEPYLDDGLATRLWTAERAAQRAARDGFWHAATSVRADLEALGGEVRQVNERYRARLTKIAREHAAEMEPYRPRLDALRERLDAAVDDVAEVELPERPEAEADGGDEAEWMFRSDRHWLDQLQHYRRAKAQELLALDDVQPVVRDIDPDDLPW